MKYELTKEDLWYQLQVKIDSVLDDAKKDIVNLFEEYIHIIEEETK